MKTKLHTLLLILTSAALLSCVSDGFEKIHFRLEDDFAGLIQIVTEEDGLRRPAYRDGLVLDIPSSGVLYVKSWPHTWQLSGSQSGKQVPAEYSGSTGALPATQVGLRSLSTTTLSNGSHVSWFYVGTEDEVEQIRPELLSMARRLEDGSW